MVLISEEELRALIREEVKHFAPLVEIQNEEERPVTQEEICNFLNISEPTVIRWRNKKVIPFLKIGSRVLYQNTKVIAALERNGKGTNYRKHS